MPTTKSAKKRLRQNLTRRARNRAVKSAVRSRMRKVRTRLAAQDLPGAEIAFRLAAKKLDQAAAKGVIHKNTAARLKSRLASRVHKTHAPAGQAASVTAP